MVQSQHVLYLKVMEKEVVGIGIYQQSDANTIAVADGIKKENYRAQT